MRPMLATPSPNRGRLPTGPEWAFEVKWDGMRVLADVVEGRLTLRSRTARVVTTAFPELSGLTALDDVLLDGEVVQLAAGRPSFAALADRMHVTDAGRARTLAAANPVTFVIFDVLRRYGVDTTARTLTDRRALLERLELPAGPWHLSPVYDDGATLLSATREQGLEGVVAKRRSSTYEVGRRSASWVKVAHRATESVVVGGWRPEIGGTRLGALLVGVPSGGGLAYRGRVGSGLGAALAADLTARLGALARPLSPFATKLPDVDRRGARWCSPEVVIDVHHTGVTAAGRMRQPVIKGLRADLTASDLEEAEDVAGG